MNNFRKLRKNVKAISPVLSVLMMIAVAVAASLVTYAWVMGYLSFTTSKVGKSIQIQSIGNSTNKLIVYVQNIGDSQVTLKANQAVYVGGVLDITAPATDLDIPQGETRGITTNTTIASGITYVVKVVSSDGTFTEATKTFP